MWVVRSAQGEPSFDTTSGLLDGKVDEEIECAGKPIELERHEIPSDDLLDAEQQLAGSDHREKGRCLDQLDAGIDPDRHHHAQSLRQEYENEDERKSHAECAPGIDLS